MPTFLGCSLLILFLLILQFPVRGSDNASPPLTPPSAAGETPASPLTREEIIKRLQELDKVTEESAKKPPPPMAMCYSPMMREMDPVDYICPSCGGKTSYQKDDLRDVESIREVFKKLSGVEACLDESGLCQKCSNGKASKQLFLELTLPGSEKKQRTPVTRADLELLSQFLQSPDWQPNVTGPEAETIGKKIHELLGIPEKK